MLQNMLEKVKTVIDGDHLIVSCPELTVKLERKEFMDTLWHQYKTLIECEIEEEYELTFDTDFSGCMSSVYGDFVIQEEETEEGEKQNFVFRFCFPETEDTEEDEIPKRIDIPANWEETKLWCEFVLRLDGRDEDIRSLRDDIIQEKEENEKSSRERAEKVAASLHGISIYPSSSIDHHAVWFEDEDANIQIHILVEELSDIADVLSGDSDSLKIDNTYEDEDHLYFEWNEEETQLSVHFIAEDGKSVVTLSKKQAEELGDKVEMIDDNSHLI